MILGCGVFDIMVVVFVVVLFGWLILLVLWFE